jgi:hypothetical protein
MSVVVSGTCGSSLIVAPDVAVDVKNSKVGILRKTALPKAEIGDRISQKSQPRGSLSQTQAVIPP